MPDRKLTILVISIIILVLGHDIDHLLRGDYRAETFAGLVPVVVVTIAKYAFLAFSLFWYVIGKVGPGFWAIAAGLGVALGWLGHFSPFSEQTPRFIFRAYTIPVAGALAVAWLAALMLALLATTLYALVLWSRASK